MKIPINEKLALQETVSVHTSGLNTTKTSFQNITQKTIMEQPLSLDKTKNPILDMKDNFKDSKSESFDEESTEDNEHCEEGCKFCRHACTGVFYLCVCMGTCIYGMFKCLECISILVGNAQ